MKHYYYETYVMLLNIHVLLLIDFEQYFSKTSFKISKNNSNISKQIYQNVFYSKLYYFIDNTWNKSSIFRCSNCERLMKGIDQQVEKSDLEIQQNIQMKAVLKAQVDS